MKHIISTAALSAVLFSGGIALLAGAPVKAEGVAQADELHKRSTVSRYTC